MHCGGELIFLFVLYIAIKSGECFGLLGINGAGKTTSFKMLTGDHEITSGEAWVKGFSVKNDMKTAYKYIGKIFSI